MPTTAPDRITQARADHRDAVAETARRRTVHAETVRELEAAEREAAVRVVDGDADGVLARVASLRAKADAFAGAIANAEAAERVAERAIADAEAAATRDALREVAGEMREAAEAADALIRELVPHLERVRTLEVRARALGHAMGAGPSFYLGRDARVCAVQAAPDRRDLLDHERMPLHGLPHGWGVAAGVDRFLEAFNA